MKEDYLDYHVLIIDDGSRDNALGLIEEYRSVDIREGCIASGQLRS